jgi:hypothetical protein
VLQLENDDGQQNPLLLYSSTQKKIIACFASLLSIKKNSKYTQFRPCPSLPQQFPSMISPRIMAPQESGRQEFRASHTGTALFLHEAPMSVVTAGIWTCGRCLKSSVFSIPTTTDGTLYKHDRSCGYNPIFGHGSGERHSMLSTLDTSVIGSGKCISVVPPLSRLFSSIL